MTVKEAAERILGAYASGVPCEPVRDIIDGADAAYAVQDYLTEYWLGQGRRLAGRKIGLTSRAVQQQLGVDSPPGGPTEITVELPTTA